LGIERLGIERAPGEGLSARIAALAPFRPVADPQPFPCFEALRAPQRHLASVARPAGTYFVTFRLADSLPATLHHRLNRVRQLNRANSFAWADRHLDAGRGSCLLATRTCAELVAATMTQADGLTYSLGTFVIMPNHAHVLIRPWAGEDVESVLHRWKASATYHLRRAGVAVDRVWQDSSLTRIVRNEAELHQWHAYILANPRTAKLRASTYLIGRGRGTWIPA
jgi:REP element-mobilizing transposase RayT